MKVDRPFGHGRIDSANVSVANGLLGVSLPAGTPGRCRGALHEPVPLRHYRARMKIANAPRRSRRSSSTRSRTYAQEIDIEIFNDRHRSHHVLDVLGVRADEQRDRGHRIRPERRTSTSTRSSTTRARSASARRDGAASASSGVPRSSMYLFVNAWFPFWLAGEVRDDGSVYARRWVEHTGRSARGLPWLHGRTALRVGTRPREFVGVRGPDAASYLQAMVSNDVEALGVGRVVRGAAPDREGTRDRAAGRLRRGVDDFLLLTEAGLASACARRCSARGSPRSARSSSRSTRRVVVLGEASPGIPTRGLRGSGVEVLDDETPSARSATRSSSSCGSAPERRGSAARSTTASFPRRQGSTACRRLREGLLPGPGADRAPALPRPREPDAARARARRRRATRVRRRARPTRGRSSAGSRARLATATASSRSRTSGSRFPRDAAPQLGDALRNAARLAVPAPVAQGIERCPAEAEVASSNLAGRITGKPRKHGVFVALGRRLAPPHAYSAPKSSRQHSSPARYWCR